MVISANMAKSGRKTRTKKIGSKVSTPTAMANTPFGIVMDAEDAIEEKNSDNAPITFTIPVTQQMPASATTPLNATFLF